jgi:hypothetical protein
MQLAQFFIVFQLQRNYIYLAMVDLVFVLAHYTI